MRRFCFVFAAGIAMLAFVGLAQEGPDRRRLPSFKDGQGWWRRHF